MVLGRVVGNVVSTRKDDNLVGYKLMIVDRLSKELESVGRSVIAIDTVGAGIGETVIMIQGSASKSTFDNPKAPIDAAIIGIIDSVELEDGSSFTA